MTAVEIEFYPSLPKTNDQFTATESEIKKNAKNFDKPFFLDPRNHFDEQAIKAACEPFMGVEHVIAIGTGGSIQTMLALAPFVEKQFHPIMNSRPSELKALFKIPGIKDKSVVIPISRGGETLDINSVLNLFSRYKMLGLSSKGTMLGILETLGAPIMDVPDLSGRFAGACTNVGLVPAYLCGIDIEKFIQGQEDGYAAYGPSIAIQTNPAKQFALYLSRIYKNGFRNVFSMPYFSWLEGAVGLFVQELSESSGKNGKGLLGTSQAAPVCQHSVLELLLGGSKYHSLPLLWVLGEDPADIPLNSNVEHIQGKTAAETILYQANATLEALITKGIPAAMITLESPTVYNMGYLIAFIQATVYYVCMLFNVNWSDNPNVVLGKNICNAAMADRRSWVELRERREATAAEQFKKFWIL